ncbi:hypothetical protein OUZ56_026075 [Daphnia magna]|uniref:Uncharacterized protein n=1 Tax=Daphnia magna TaxID=35525 RepID=A0ABQ9ZKT5_9CRUS|nr:hypothetical protein OUZ56_026075 [Daphnia magna]
MTDGCHKDAVIPAVSHLPPIADVVANEQQNESVCDNMTNEEVETSTSKAGCCGVTSRMSKALICNEY